MMLPIRKFVILCVFSNFAASAVRADECAHRIIFLPQTHDADKLTGSQISDAQRKDVAASQLKVARYLEQNPDLPVFSEQAAAKDYFWTEIPADRRMALRSLYTQIFPRGLPESAEKLTGIQKQKLIDNGGDFVQLIRGSTGALHRVVENEDELGKIFKPIEAWFSTHPPPDLAYPPAVGSLVYGSRERAALSQIQKFFSGNAAQRDVILIFGLNHNFGFYPELFPPHCVVVPAEFQSGWDGRYRTGPEGF